MAAEARGADPGAEEGEEVTTIEERRQRVQRNVLDFKARAIAYMESVALLEALDVTAFDFEKGFAEGLLPACEHEWQDRMRWEASITE